MACYHPMLGVADLDAGLTDNGSFRYKISGSYNPEINKIIPGSLTVKIPCGHCVGCRLDQSRQWADRMMLELDSYYGKGIFLTLTYDQDHVPIASNDEGEFLGFTLCKEDVQRFMKRLRKWCENKVNLRFYLCGEYGKNTHRPHYHAIIFGLNIYDFSDLKKIGMNELGQIYYQSDILAKIWNKGFILISDVSYKTCAYVARYVTKKIGVYEEEDGIENVFHLMSRRPGLGYQYLVDHPDCVDFRKAYVSINNESIGVFIPKYFLDKIKVEDPDRYRILCKERVNCSRDSELLQLQATNLSYLDYLELKENELLNKTQILFILREEQL